ncbi:hypothetical protein JCM16303_001774 [Sporobolomyces ruberrimus]
MTSVASGSRLSESPPVTLEPDRHTIPTHELERRLKLRLEYATYKVSQRRPHHSLSELENLHSNPFARQARQRREGRANALVEKLSNSNRIEEREESVERGDVWATMGWYKPCDDVGKGKGRAVEEEDYDDEPPTPPPIYDLLPQDQPVEPIPFLAICPAKPPSERGSSVETVVEETCEEALQTDKRARAQFQPTRYDPQAYSASELMLSLRNGSSFSSSSNSNTSQTHSTDSSTIPLLPHKNVSSPFSSYNLPLSTTLAPASLTSTLTIPAILETHASSRTSSSSSVSLRSPNSQASSAATRRTFPILPQVSFSALPPPPPLPFVSERPTSSQVEQTRAEETERENRKRTLRSNSSPEQQGRSSLGRKEKRQKLDDPTLDRNGVARRSHLVSSSPPKFPLSSSSPPFDSPFPFSTTQSFTNSQPQEDLVEEAGGTGEGNVGGREDEFEESQETMVFESQETEEEGRETLESQESLEY